MLLCFVHKCDSDKDALAYIAWGLIKV